MLILFVLIFILIAPQSRTYLAGLFLGLTTFMTAWAPFSYLLLVTVVAALFAGVYLIKSWPKHVEPENPMAKYRRDAPIEED